MKKHILVIEDDAHIRLGLCEALRAESYDVTDCCSGSEAVPLFKQRKPDLVVLDIMLPGKSGYDICREIRATKSRVPILMLSAKGQEIDKVVGLELGADDYVTKPFSIKELLARAEAFLRRRRKSAVTAFEFGDCRLDPEARSLARAGEDVPLSPKEFELLAYFTAHAGRALSRDTIMTNVWGYDAMVTPRSIDRFVNALRNKIEVDPTEPRFIKTVREFGYKFEP